MPGLKAGVFSCFKFTFCYSLEESDINSDPDNLHDHDSEAKHDAFISNTQGHTSGHTQTRNMSKYEVVASSKKYVTFEEIDKVVEKDSKPASGYIETNEQKSKITGSGNFESRYGRAISHPVDPDEVRLAQMQIGSGQEEFLRFQSIPSASSRRSQRNNRRRTINSLYGVNPSCKFGPKGYISTSPTDCFSDSAEHSRDSPSSVSGIEPEEALVVKRKQRLRLRFIRAIRPFEMYDALWVKPGTAYEHDTVAIPDPSNQKLLWQKPPLTVLIIRKHQDDSVLTPFRDLVIWLIQEKNMVVHVEKMVLEEHFLQQDEKFQLIKNRLRVFKEGVDDLTDKVDFIICLGGDGTLLYVSSLFQSSVPPVMAFNMGSLGFLTPFQFYEDFKSEVSRVMEGSASLLLRFRLKCVVMTHDTASMGCIPHVKHIHKEHYSLKEHKLVLNEVVIDRGPSSYLSNLDLYIEGRHVTTVQGDGLIISTPTGSTAYAVAAGASMIHPSVPCILVTPICPHSLSFRPVVVPAGVEIRVVLSPGSRGTAMVSFDGRDRLEIHQGDSLRITTSMYPVPSICAADQIADWFDGLSVCLNWNLRLTQRPLKGSGSLTSLDSYDGISTPMPYTSSPLNSVSEKTSK